MSTIRLFHVGFDIIKKPDIRIGRSNADFGQGFYLSDDQEFSKRWARERRGFSTYLNAYELQTEGLRIKQFHRDEEWFDYIYANRSNMPDSLKDFDVITGPIANDTLYDTWGIITSGQLKKEDALSLLMIGNIYEQTVIKSEKAAASLRFLQAKKLSGDEIESYRETVKKEEEAFQQQFAELLVQILGFTE